MVSARVHVPVGDADVVGDLVVPTPVQGMVLLGPGGSRGTASDQTLARVLHAVGWGTLVLDLSCGDPDGAAGSVVAGQLTTAVDWLGGDPHTEGLPVALLGDGSHAGAILAAAAQCPDQVESVALYGGPADLAGIPLHWVRAPVLILAPGLDPEALTRSEHLARRLGAACRVHVTPGADRRFTQSQSRDLTAHAAARFFQHPDDPPAAPLPRSAPR